MGEQHDQAFLQILSEEKNISNFLDSFFGFLFRCTDFYVESSVENQIGFLPGTVENLVNESFQKWKFKSLLSEKASSNFEQSEIPSEIAQEILIDTVSQEIEIEGSEKPYKNLIFSEQSSDSYNGAVRENYSWSQTISDLSVIVKIPEDLKTIDQLQVSIGPEDLKILIKSDKLKDCNEITEWNTFLCEQFCFKIRKDESYWSFVSGQHIIIHLEKVVERWWEALLLGEPKIELTKIDCSRNLDELKAEEQMKLEELIWNHHQKLLKKPTSEQIRIEDILKKAWNAEGSPFKGRAYNPSLFKLN